MKQRIGRFVFLGLLTVLAILSAYGQQDPNLLTEPEAILQTVQKYVSFSNEGKLKELESITTTIPVFALRKKQPPSKSKLPPNTIYIAPKEDKSNGRSLWLLTYLPKSIWEDQNRLVKIGEVVRKANLAKLPVYLGNSKVYSRLPYVFMLVQDEKDGSWKIYDVCTPAYAEDYYP